MSGISTTIRLIDNVTVPIQNIITGLTNVGNAFDTVDDRADEAQKALSDMAKEINKTVDEQNNMNTGMNNSIFSVGKLTTAVSGLIGAYVGLQGAMKAIDFAKGSLDFADVQNRAETQLQTVLMNQGATLDAYKAIKQTASDIQGMGIYGDEAMLGGAGELATYISDPEAIKSMMGTLANYASGMSGGGEVGYEQMVNYATQLGKALDGTYDGLTKKGFVLSDQQKEIIENGTDMQKALVLDEVIGQSWNNLYETMSNTPEGAIIQMQNSLGDLREEVGNRLYPVVATVANAITEHMNVIQMLLNGFTIILGTVGSVFAWVLNLILIGLGYVGQAIGVVVNFLWSMLQVGISVTMGLDSAMVTVAENMSVAFQNSINGIKGFFYSLLSTAMSVISQIAQELNKLPFVEVDFSGLNAKAIEYGNKAIEANNAKEQYKDWGASFAEGYSKGAGVTSNLKNKFKFDAWDSTLNWGTGSGSGFAGLADTVGGIGNNAGKTAGNTGRMADSLDITNEELKYLNDIAERDAINRFTTAEIKVEMNNQNTIGSNLDIDGVINYLAEGISEAMSRTAEGVYA